MALTGLDPSGVEEAAGVLRSQALVLDDLGHRVRQALVLADLTDGVPTRLFDRADQLSAVADELTQRAAMVRDLRIALPDHVVHALGDRILGGLDSFLTLDELDQAIGKWSGSDNDPILDDLIRQRTERLGLFPGLTAAQAGWAEQSGLTPEQVMVALALGELDALNARIGSWSGSDNDPVLDAAIARRRELVGELVGHHDPGVVRAVQRAVDGGGDFNTALDAAVVEAYSGLSITELNHRFAAEMENNQLAGSAILELRAGAVVEFAGGAPGELDPYIAGFAQDNHTSYNQVVRVLNDESEVDIEFGPMGPIDALVALGDEGLFAELDTARDGKGWFTDGKDGTFSTDDLQAVVDDPNGFSVEAVELARYMLDNPEVHLTVDTAGNGAFLDGMATGDLRGEVARADGRVSARDVEQSIVNVHTLSILNAHAAAIDTDNNGSASEAELQSFLDTLTDGNVRSAVEYALSEDAFSDRDRRSTGQKLADAGWEISSLIPTSPANIVRLATEPGELLSDHGSFGKGMFWDLPKGMAVLAWDASSLVPGQPAWLVEGFRASRDPDHQHRGVALLTGVKDLANAAATLNPTSPAFWNELAEVRNSGRWSEHAGFTAVAQVANWELLLDDPSRWAGLITGEIAIDVITGGGGAAGAATRRAALGAAVRSADNLVAGTQQGLRSAGRQIDNVAHAGAIAFGLNGPTPNLALAAPGPTAATSVRTFQGTLDHLQTARNNLTTLSKRLDGDGDITPPMGIDPSGHFPTKPGGLQPGDRTPKTVAGQPNDLTDPSLSGRDLEAKALENTTAEWAAGQGFRINQLPEGATPVDRWGNLPPRPDARPDYLVEGEYVDLLSPVTASAENALTGAVEKLEKGQSQRIWISLDRPDQTLTPFDLKREVPKLHQRIQAVGRKSRRPAIEVTAIKDGQRMTLYP